MMPRMWKSCPKSSQIQMKPLACPAMGPRSTAPQDRLGRPQTLRPEVKRIIEALAKDIVAREDREAAAAAAKERSAA
jgi:hypothetical protein